MSAAVDISELLLELGLSGTVTEEERALAQTALVRAEGAVKRHLKYDPFQRTRTEYYSGMDFTQKGRESVWEVNDTVAYLRQLSEASTDELQVRHLPIRQITLLAVDYNGRNDTLSGAFSETWTEGTDFWANYDAVDDDGNKLCTDGIIRSHGRWPATAGSVKIVYVAGYSAAELHGQKNLIDASPINEAIIDEAVRRFLKVKSRVKKSAAGFVGPFSSESLGDYSYSLDTSALQKLVGGDNDILPETQQKLADFVNWGWMLAS